MNIKFSLAAVVVICAAGAANAATLSLDAITPLSPQFSKTSSNFHPQGLGYDTTSGELLYMQQSARTIERSTTAGVGTGTVSLLGSGNGHTTSVAADATNYYYSTYTRNTSGADLYSQNKVTGIVTQISSEVAGYGGYPIDVRDGKMYRSDVSTSYSWSMLSTLRISNLSSVDTIDQTVNLATTSGIGDFGIDSVNNEAWVLDYSAAASIRRFDLNTGALLDVFALGLDGLDAGLTYADGKLYYYDWNSVSGSTLSTFSVAGVAAPAVPLPAGGLLLLSGLLGVAGLKRRQKRAA